MTSLQRIDFDFSPLLRSMIGFDQMARSLENSLGAQSSGYPPYNIEKSGENEYRISMAVAGFGLDDLDITVENNLLTVKGEKREDSKKDTAQYLHRGIATRAFEQRFSLADHVEVKDASIDNGMLHIDLVREVPEKMKPRKISINVNNETLVGKAKSLLGAKAA